jgi:hypothetical protein
MQKFLISSAMVVALAAPAFAAVLPPTTKGAPARIIGLRR